ncbi:hypothetical protein ANN_11196 [Periplaneta americana]|uniref:Uncharacterized protein n=1 Tax=Periplaneta americana TaxID=6978 RepID=A0ABQ8T4B7_PERAM|nr:hypothetical protein ANN_11196 [Periplaneta americana]
MNVSRLEQRAYVKIAVLRSQNARECHAQLVEASAGRGMLYRIVPRWVAAFQSGRVKVPTNLVWDALGLFEPMLVVPR